MAFRDWAVVETDRGYVLEWRGRRWPMKPRRTREDAEAYRLRVSSRYPGTSPALLMGTDDSERDTPKRRRGGPWRYRYPDPETDEEVEGVIHTKRKKDAKKILRRRLDRKRLPSGITWEIAQELPPPE